MEEVLDRLLRVLPDLLVFIVSLLGQTAGRGLAARLESGGRQPPDPARHRRRGRGVDGGFAVRVPAALSTAWPGIFPAGG